MVERGVHRRRLLLGAAALLGASTRVRAAEVTRSRRELARKLARVRPADPAYARRGVWITSEKDLRVLIGPPDRIRVIPDGDGEGLASRVLMYGSDGPEELATLGEVEVDAEGRVTAVRGGMGSPPAAGLFAERYLRSLLRLIHSAPEPDHPVADRDWDPATMVRVVNGLLRLGKTRALAALGEYSRITAETLPGEVYSPTRDDAVFSVMALMFGHPPDPRRYGWQFRLSCAGDIPFLVRVPTGDLSGVHGTFPVDSVRYHRAGRLRTSPLTPTDAPLRALAEVEAELRRALGEGYGGEDQRRLRTQLLRMLDPVLPVAPADRLDWGLDTAELQRRWERITARLSRQPVQWDAGRAEYRRLP